MYGRCRAWSVCGKMSAGVSEGTGKQGEVVTRQPCFSSLFLFWTPSTIPNAGSVVVEVRGEGCHTKVFQQFALVAALP